jgi:EpsI family protein
MFEARGILVPLFLVAQAGLVHLVAGFERPPAPPDLPRLPVEIGNWKRLSEVPIASDVAHEIGADWMSSCTYFHPSARSTADLFVAWFQSQRGGASQPHSPKVCLPAAGWRPETTGEIALATRAGAVQVNRYVITKGKERAVVLYWYQTPRRVIAGEWGAKLWLVADALQDHRTDTALVRIIAWAYRDVEQATAEAGGFASEVYPVLRERLPQ